MAGNGHASTVFGSSAPADLTQTHSAHGNTGHIARLVADGAATVPGVQVTLLQAGDLTPSPEQLLAYDGFVFGSPTYLGGVSAPFKAFMDATGRLWKSHALKGRLAAGFTVSALPSGDKQSTLMSMFVFAMQHGMVWVGNPILPEQHRGAPYDEAANRLGSWSGLMAQAGVRYGEHRRITDALEGERRFVRAAQLAQRYGH